MKDKKLPVPNLFVSRCLGFAKCRWNGDVIRDDFVETLKPYVRIVHNCPEAEIGLGIPRDPVRIVYRENKFRLMQLNTGRDLTAEMNLFSRKQLGSLKDVDGFILKDRSPSCGIKDVKVYPGLAPSSSIKKRPGFFAAAVLRYFPRAAVETEARLTNFTIREHFLARIFTFARFREVKESGRMKDLIEFHAETKLLLMAYNQEGMRTLGNIVANRGKTPAEEIFARYEPILAQVLSGLPRYTAVINVLMHALGYFSKKLGMEEKKFFLNTLEEFRREQIPVSVPVNLLKSYIIRFGEPYLAKQTFFEIYPQELVRVKDSGKGRSYK